MIADAIDLLDRQVAFLNGLEGRSFLWALRPFFVAIRSDPRIHSAIGELLADANGELEAYNRRRRELRDSVVAIRRDVAATFPAVDDCAMAPCEPDDPSWLAYSSSLAFFDRIAGGMADEKWPPDHASYNERDVLFRLGELLRAKLNAVGPSANLADAEAFHPRLGDFVRRLRHSRRHYFLSSVSSAVATSRLFLCAMSLNPDPSEYKPPDTTADMIVMALAETYSAAALLRRFLYSDVSVVDKGVEKELIEPMRGYVGLLHLEVRRRLGLARSLRAIVDRYAARCMWHEAARLRQLSDKGTNHENPLRDDFARYLHDQGLNPLTEPITAGLRPDIVASMPNWTIYVEAKQYATARERAKLVSGMHQVWDTLTRMRGSAFEVREAFYLVFRRGGPACAFESSELRALGLTVYPVVVDVAETSVSGSRQKKQPILLTSAELLPRPSTP